MDGLKGAVLFIATVVFLVQAYLLLITLPGIQSIRNNTKRNSLIRRIMVSNISHLEVRHHTWEHVENISLIRTVLNTSDGLEETPSSEELAPVVPQQSHCSYKIQVYDKNKRAVHSPILQKVVEQSKKGQHVRTDITCGSNCNIELTIADDMNRFKGMDAVVFHFMKGLIPARHPPASMNPSQTWVYFTWESPYSNSHEQAGIGKLPVHATWTYHRASDITIPYGFYRPGVPMANQTKSTDEWMEGKTKLIAWMASNCKGTSWPRTGFVTELKKYIKVDAYGACGNLKCTPAYSPKCTVDLMRQYKFYLSLENAECEDYITEKLWNKPLMQGVVPIVYGPRRQVYEELLPPNSFIYIGDYRNVEELANYLKLLDSKPELYVKYLEWQYKGSVGVPKQMHDSYDPSIFCSLIPVIERVKTGGMKRASVGKSEFSNSCRKPNKSKDLTKDGFGLGKWRPW